MQKIVECVPNFSEGRDQGVIDQIALAIKQVEGVTLLDVILEPIPIGPLLPLSVILKL